MLAVHWTPVNNTKSILKNGITKSNKGLYCFPLTGLKSVDRWWIHFFNQCKVREKKNYNGIVFKIKQEDMPAYFGHWVGATNKDNFDKEIKTVEELGKNFRETIMWRLGEEIARQLDIPHNDQNSDLYLRLAEQEILKSPKTYNEQMKSIDFMAFTFEDYQIVLSSSIPAKRIIKVMPQGDEFGRVIRQKKKELYKKKADLEY